MTLGLNLEEVLSKPIFRILSSERELIISEQFHCEILKLEVLGYNLCTFFLGLIPF